MGKASYIEDASAFAPRAIRPIRRQAVAIAAGTCRFSTWLRAAACALATAVATVLAQNVVAFDDPIAEAIRSQLDDIGESSGALVRPAFAAYRSALRRFYSDIALSPAWLNDGRAREVVTALQSASGHGLDPRAYDIGWIEARLGEHHALPPALAAIDIAMTLALFRLLDDVHSGQIDPRSVGVRFSPERSRFDPVRAVQAAREQGQLVDALAIAAPHWPMYRALKEALERYRVMAMRAPPRAIPDGPPIRPGGAPPDLTQLRELLITLGDLAPDAVATDAYDGPLVEAVKRFQRRHGLHADGIVGRATRAALNVPLATRVRQIELALERLRWLPAMESERAIAVNVPAFTLWAVENLAARPIVRLQSKVIVGRAPETQTPLFATLVHGVEFNPYWNVPKSIAAKEIVPMLRRNRAYLEREEMEIVTRETPPRIISTVTARTLAQLERGALRVRQRPGHKNALGRLKLLMPNDLDIYLHDTPARALFARTRRDFSHGCIRVEKIAELAAFLLADAAGWDEQQIDAAMQSGTRRIVRLSEPVPVILFYTTVMADAGGGIQFLPDLYGYDRVLDGALAKRLAARLPTANASGIEVDKVRAGVEAHATQSQRPRRITHIGERDTGEPNIDRAPLNVQAVTRYAATTPA